MLAEFPESFERGVPHTLCRVLVPSLSHIPLQGFRAPWMPWPSELRHGHYRSQCPKSQPAPSVQVANEPWASVYTPPTPLISPPRKKAGRPRKSRGGVLPGTSVKSSRLDSCAAARQRLAPFVSPLASSRLALIASTSPEIPLRVTMSTPRLSPNLPRTISETRLSNTPATQNEISPVSSTPRSDSKQLTGHGDPHRGTLPSSSPAPTEPERCAPRRSPRKNRAAAATNNISSTERPLESASIASTKRKIDDDDEHSRPSKRIRGPSAESETPARTKQPAPSKQNKNTSGNSSPSATRSRARKRMNSDKPIRAPKKRKT